MRLYESRPGLQERARQALAQWREIPPAEVPNRTRLWCHVIAGMQYGGERTLEGLRDLEQSTHRCGFQALASVCRLHVMDQLLVEGRDEEVLVAAEQVLRTGEPRPRVKGTMLHVQAQALLRLGRVHEARQTALAALQVLARVSHLMLCTLALAAVREGQPRDAALMAGWVERVLRERDLQMDPVDADFHQETLARLQQLLPRERLAALMGVGAAMPAAEMLALVLAPAGPPPATAGGSSAPPGPAS